MENEITVPRPDFTCTQPVKINLRSYVMRLLEKERLQRSGSVIPGGNSGGSHSGSSLDWRKQKFSAPHTGA